MHEPTTMPFIQRNATSHIERIAPSYFPPTIFDIVMFLVELCFDRINPT